jgi:hypothetical protein
MTKIVSDNDLEILIATKDQSSLDFLLPMFVYKHFSFFNILIINQSESEILVSNFSTVRVINTKEKGLSKSRNMAIKNAIKNICLIADDDVVYSLNFNEEIINSFNQNLEASIITFNHQRIGLDKPQRTSQITYRHSEKTIWEVSSIEIAFRLSVIKEKNLFFDEYFGLGSYFETAEEFLFLREAIKLNLKLYFSPKIMVSHPLISSGNDQANDKLVYARSALFYKIKSNFVYLWLLKYLFFLIRNNYIKSSEFMQKFKVGLSGVDKYKELEQVKNV